MKDETKKTNVKVEMNDDDLDLVAGGTYVDGNPINYRCGFCGQTSLYHSKAEIMNHVTQCSKNPNNF